MQSSVLGHWTHSQVKFIKTVFLTSDSTQIMIHHLWVAEFKGYTFVMICKCWKVNYKLFKEPLCLKTAEEFY